MRKNIKASVKKTILILVASLFLSPVATQAAPVQWFIYDLTFADGATGSGSFFYDADAPAGSPSAYSNIDVTISGGSVFADTTYNTLRFSLSVSAEFMWFVVDSGTSPNDPMFAATLDGPMTAEGGALNFVTVGNPNVFSQSLCFSTSTSNCALGGSPQNVITGGYISTTAPVPLPAAMWLLSTAVFGLGISSFKNGSARAR